MRGEAKMVENLKWVVEDIYSTFDTNDGAKYNSQFNTLNKNYALKPGEMLS